MMKRLTMRLDDGRAVMRCEECKEGRNGVAGEGCTAMYCRNMCKDRLAAYEDTGLEPREVSAIVKEWSDLCTVIGECGGIGRLRELAEADKDGRVVVLPCKPGDTVYMISWRLNGRHEIEERVFSLTYFNPAKYGKDYFLSREAAEEALEAMK